MRIDKFLANMGVGTRNEVKQLLKKGLSMGQCMYRSVPCSYQTGMAESV